MNRDAAEVLAKLRENMPMFTETYNVETLELFGSFVRGRQKKGSDLDILVEFSESIDLFRFVELEQLLTEMLGRKVDLVMKDTLKPRIKERILKEALPV